MNLLGIFLTIGKNTYHIVQTNNALDLKTYCCANVYYTAFWTIVSMFVLISVWSFIGVVSFFLYMCGFNDPWKKIKNLSKNSLIK